MLTVAAPRLVTTTWSPPVTTPAGSEKPRKVLGVCQFPTFRGAMEAARHIVALDPEAVELVDRTMINLGRGIAIYRPTIERMLIGEPDSLLIVEFHGHDDAPLRAKLADLESLMGDLGYPGAMVRATEAEFQADIAAVREAGLNIMMSMKGDAKPVSFIEDCAVRLEDLADYTERLNEVFARHGTKGTWYAHASVGCLHVRPVLNMKNPADVATMRAVAEECFALVREYKGSHSGEHGDGIVRSEFHAEMFGPRIVRAFERVKDAFDPAGLLNPGRIVRPPRMDDRALFRYPPGYAPAPGFTPRLDWSDHPGGMLGAVEMCNNNGTCRALNAGVMCPSYRATLDEEHLTRGRANTLRLAMTGQLGPAAMASDAVADALRLCVSCKACRRECPTGVDMAKMKIEVLAARAERRGIGARERLVAGLPRTAPILVRLPWATRLQGSLPARTALARLGFAPDRSYPALLRDHFRNEAAGQCPGPEGLVLLPGSAGFKSADGTIVNPSYYIYPALNDFARILPSPEWGRLRRDGLRLLADGRSVLLITDGRGHASAADAEHVLVASVDGPTLYDSMVAPTWMLESLAAEVAAARRDDLLQQTRGNA